MVGVIVRADRDAIYRFGVFEYNDRTGDLRKNGSKVRLQDQSRHVLAKLLARSGELVTREELRTLIWPEDTFVDFETGLNTIIKRLRDTLGDSADTPRFVETIPRRGYRFVGHVELLQKTTAPESEPDVAKPDTSSTTTRRNRLYVGAAVTAVCAGVALIAVYTLTRSSASPSANLNVVPLTSYPGAEFFPSFSPDGNEIVFAWNASETGPDFDLYRKQVGSETAVRLTTIHAPWIAPAWSPDGRYIAYICARSGDQDGLYVIPALGGPPHKLGEVSTAVWVLPSSSWSPDSKWLAFPGRDPSVDYAVAPGARIHLLNIETLEQRILPNPSPTCTVALSPVFSSDGNEIASYCAEESGMIGAVYIQSVHGQTIRKFQQLLGSFDGLTWTSDGNTIVYSLNNSLWRQAATGGIPERLLFGQDASAPAISRTGDRLAFVQANLETENGNIWGLKLRTPIDPEGVPIRLIASSRGQSQPRISPDGRHIAFMSRRSGAKRYG